MCVCALAGFRAERDERKNAFQIESSALRFGAQLCICAIQHMRNDLRHQGPKSECDYLSFYLLVGVHLLFALTQRNQIVFFSYFTCFASFSGHLTARPYMHIQQTFEHVCMCMDGCGTTQSLITELATSFIGILVVYFSTVTPFMSWLVVLLSPFSLNSTDSAPSYTPNGGRRFKVI